MPTEFQTIKSRIPNPDMTEIMLTKEITNIGFLPMRKQRRRSAMQ